VVGALFTPESRKRSAGCLKRRAARPSINARRRSDPWGGADAFPRDIELPSIRRPPAVDFGRRPGRPRAAWAVLYVSWRSRSTGNHPTNDIKRRDTIS